MPLSGPKRRSSKRRRRLHPTSHSGQLNPRSQSARRGVGLLLPAALAAVALLALLLVWQWTAVTQRSRAHPRLTRARLVFQTNARTVNRPRLARLPLQTSAPSPATAAADTLAADAATAPTNAPVADAQESETTNAPAMTPPPPPKPAPLRLQAIVFNPKRPSAMISGKTLFIGDKLGDLRVVAIDQDSATLVGAGQTNVLSLAE